MSAIIESYKQMYAAKNRAVEKALKESQKQTKQKQNKVRDAAAEDIRAAYGKLVREQSLSEQKNRADGRFGGAAENQKSGLAIRHRDARQSTAAKADEDIRSLSWKLQKESDKAAEKIAENNAALEQKISAQLVKEQKAALSAAQKAQKSAASALKSQRASVLQMIKMGIYDPSFAGILGVSDEQVLAILQEQDQEKAEKAALAARKAEAQIEKMKE